MTSPDGPLGDVSGGPAAGPLFSAGRHLLGWPIVPAFSVADAARAGHFVWVEPGVELMIGGNHRLDWVTTFPVREIYGLPGARVGVPWSKGNIIVGNGVRLQRGAKVLSGVTIGDGARVAPYSVVVRDVRPYSVVAGNPAREVGSRFDLETVGRLAPTRWWEWSDDMTIWRLNRLTRGQAHVLAPQLGRTGPRRRRAALRLFAARLLRGLAHRLEVTDPSEAPVPVAPLPVASPPADQLDDTPEATALPSLPATVPMGRGSYGFPAVHGPNDRVSIGNYCSIAFESVIVVEGTEHPAPCRARTAIRDAVSSTSAASGPEVRLGNDVWVGRGACILPGVTVGDGAAIAAYSVVHEDVRPYAVVAGNPAREVKRRFDDSTVAALLRIRWWDWSEAAVGDRAGDLCSEDISGFIASYAPDDHDEGNRTTP